MEEVRKYANEVVTLSREGESSSFALIRNHGLSLDRFKAYREAIEGARYHRSGRCNIAPIDKVPAILRRLREADFKVTVESDLSAVLRDHTAQQWLDLRGAQERARKIDEELRARNLNLFPYQRYGVQWLATRLAGLLADEQGLGKTVQAITAIPAGVPILVIAPAVAKGVWMREVGKWRPHLKVSVLKGRNSFRWPERGEMVITNADILPNIHQPPCDGKLPPKRCPGCNVGLNDNGIRVKLPGHKQECNGFLEERDDCPGCHKILDLPLPDTIFLVDEAQVFKSWAAARTKKGHAMAAAVRRKGGRTWLLTGTPMMNEPRELWTLYKVAGIEGEAFGDWGNFVRLFKGKTLYFGGYEWGTPEAEVAERIQRVSLRRKREDVLPDLPVKTYREIEVDVDRQALQECDKFLEEHGGIERVIALIEAEGIRFETMSRVRAALAKAKTKPALEMVKTLEAEGVPIVLFSAHRFPIDLIGKRPGWRTITGDTPAHQRTEIEDAFQRGELKGVACTIKAGGTAITLTRSHYALYVDREFTPSANAQSEDRICRIGQTRGCQIEILVANHQLDRRVAELLTKKQALITQSIDAAREAEKSYERADTEREAELLDEANAVRAATGRAIRRFPEAAEEKWAFEQLHSLEFRPNDKRLALSLAEEASTIGLSDAQWRLAVRLCERQEEGKEAS